MKIIVVYGAMPNYDAELGKVLKIVSDTLSELEVELDMVNLAFEQIPYYDGIVSKVAGGILQRIESANGVIFATTSMLYGIPAIMRAFLEHIVFDEYNRALNGKNCMTIICSHTGDERSSLNEFSRILNNFGAFDSVKIGVPSVVAMELAEDTSEIITRQTEDFYRIVRQNRKFIIPGANTNSVSVVVQAVQENNRYEEPPQEARHLNPDIAAVYEKLNLRSMTRKQEKDVGDIAQMLSKRHVNNKEERPGAASKMPSQSSKVQQPKQARLRTCRQMTQSMPHYFQPQMASGFTAVVQINITGDEQFEGHIVINNTDCQYIEGAYSAPDITIISDAAVWKDVLIGKSSAQKAFMIGKLKVRGNFVVLTKLEQLFKPMT